MARARASLWMIGMTLATVAVMLLWPVSSEMEVITVEVHAGEFLQTTLLSATVVYENEQVIVSGMDGKIHTVHVTPGQSVKKDQLLFSLDTSAEEEMLSYVMNVRQKQLQAEGTLAVLAAQETTVLLEKETQLRAKIEAAHIRAWQDGWVDQVYVQAGEYAQTAQLLGVVRGEKLCVKAISDLETFKNARIGSVAVVRKEDRVVGSASLQALEAPVMNNMSGKIVQEAVFALVADEVLEAGDRLTLEMITNRVEAEALIPKAAVSSHNEVWIVDDGCVTPAKVDVSVRNDAWVLAGRELCGKTVVLLPDQFELAAGCTVKTAEEK